MKVKIDYSAGRGKNGNRYAYIRPAGKCHNRSRRVSADADRVLDTIERHFPEVKYYKIEGLVIGAKSPEFALREFWRICERKDIGKPFQVAIIETDQE